MDDTTKRSHLEVAQHGAETTQRDIFPPNFDQPGVFKLPVAPGQPPAAASVADRDFPLPEMEAPAAEGRGGGDDGARVFDASSVREFSRPNIPATPSEPAPRDQTRTPSGVAEMTFASKLPIDHPGLQLERPQGRTLRRGPVLAAGALLGLAVTIAAIVAFTPKPHEAQAATSPTADGTAKNITISDAVTNAPGDAAPLHPPPKLGPPLNGDDPPKPAAAHGSSSFGRQTQRQLAQEERDKARSSSILVDIDIPQQDHGGPGAGAASAAAALVGAAMNQATPKSDQSPSPAASAGGDANLQQHKSDFVTRDGVSNATYLSQPVLMPRSPFEIKAGTIIPTTLLTGINSDLPGQIVGQVRENVFDTVSGAYLLIPQGSRLIAAYDSAVAFGQERVLVCWNRLIRPDGVSDVSRVHAWRRPHRQLRLLRRGQPPLVADHHRCRSRHAALCDRHRAAGNVTGYNPTVPQLWAQNAGGAANQAAQQITQKNLAIQPTITIRPGYSVNVLVSKDIVIQPYVQPRSR